MSTKPLPGKPSKPAGLASEGARLWRSIVTLYELGPDEVALLTQACRQVDMLAVLEARVAMDGPVVEGSKGQPRAHPAIGELQRGREVLRRLLGALELPDDGASPMTRQAAKAASSRWLRARAVDKQRSARGATA